MSAAAAAPRAFAALRHPGFRVYFFTSAIAMMADSIEHVISYWILFQKFQSPALAGFAVIAHWLPFLLFAVWSGALADRYDPRRIIQIGMGLFMAVSVAWGALFMTDTLEMWHAVLLLVVHGCAGMLWTPASQLLLHDIVGREHLQSAVRLNATARWLGLLLGPAVGGGLLLLLGPAWGLLFNALIYLPLLLWLWKAPYGPRFRTTPTTAAPTPAIRGTRDLLDSLRAIAGNRPVVSMIALAGCASLFIGNAYQAQMPGFAHDLGHGDADLSYSALLAADAAGALIAGLVLESRSMLQARPRTAFILAMLWCLAIGGFAVCTVYWLALALLFVAGFMGLAFNAMAQTLVQLHAPPAIRGRVIGLYTMSALGLRTFAGVTVGMLGSVVGIHGSLALSALALLTVIVTLLAFTLRGRGAG
ncbi:MAG: MFS transporter [Burkholderiales bacterium]